MPPAGSSDGGRLEDKTDCTAHADAALSQASSLLSSGALDDAIALLMTAEKKCRIGNDTPNLVRIVNRITEALIAQRNPSIPWSALRRSIETICSRRSQKTAAITAAVSAGVDALSKYDACEKGFEASVEEAENTARLLRDLTDGRIYLERERADLTLRLAKMMENRGDIDGAAEIMQDVHVETYGSIPKRGKIDFILEQMRLTLAKGDYVRAAIVANKVNRKALGEVGMEGRRIAFYELMAQYHRHEKDAFALSKDYHQMYLTWCPKVSGPDEEGEEEKKMEVEGNDIKNEEKALEALKSAVNFLVLSPHSMEQQDMLNRIALDKKKLELIAPFKTTIELFLKKEIIAYPLAHQSELDIPSLSEGGPDLASHWRSTLRARVIQHNVRVASKYYRRIHKKRLAELLGLDPDELEKEVAAMVSDGSVYAKIDRPNDIVRFAQTKSPEAVLSDWAADVTKLLDLVETTTHLIHKEQMMQ